MEDEPDELVSLDSSSPMVVMIKVMQEKIKKPEFDDTLSKILDQFLKLIIEESVYIDNGIVQKSLIEDALLLEICAVYYGKRVDKYWNLLLELHTWMLKCEHKQVDDKDRKRAREEEVTRLEERINRGKRKKIQLKEIREIFTTPPPSPSPSEDQFLNLAELFPSRSPNLNNEQRKQTSDSNSSAQRSYRTRIWKGIMRAEALAMKRCFGSTLVQQVWKLSCRISPYASPSATNPVYDLHQPETFNTSEGKLLSCHCIRHLFEYNDSCLLPDCDSTIVRLRFGYNVRARWLLQNNISLSEPYETYKDRWEVYSQEYIKNEKRKIQNMPQDNPKNIKRFLKALAQKELQAEKIVQKMRERGEPLIPFINLHNVVIEPAANPYYDGPFDPYIPEGFETVDSDIEDNEHPPSSPLEGENEAELNDLMNQTPQNQTPVKMGSIITRNDSGYGETPGQVEERSDRADQTPFEQVSAGDTPFEFDIPDAIDEIPNAEQITSLESETTDSNNGAVSARPTLEQRLQQDIDWQEMRQRIRTFTQENVPDGEKIFEVLEDSYLEEFDGVITIIYNKPEIYERMRQSLWEEQMISFDSSPFRVKRSRNKKKSSENKEYVKVVQGTFKVKRLSQSVIDKLKKGIIRPVKLQKWESFFSMNYQSDVGEGQVLPVEYESSDSEADFEGCDNFGTANDGEMPFQDGTGENNYVISQHFQRLEGEDLVKSGIRILEEAAKVIDHLPPVKKVELTERQRNRLELKERVDTWKCYITSKLKELEGIDFNIHEVSADVINRLSPNESTKFGDFVANESAANITRYLVSVLHLTSALNVEIGGVTPGELANDTLEVRLLRKKQHHENLSTFQPPSQMSKPSKLEKIKRIRQGRMGEERKRIREESTFKANSRKKRRVKDVSRSVVEPSTSTGELQQQPSTSTGLQRNAVQPNTSDSGVGLEQPSTSWLAEELDQEDAMSVLQNLNLDCDIPFGDEAFVAQFIELQETTDFPLQSTPMHVSSQ